MPSDSQMTDLPASPFSTVSDRNLYSKLDASFARAGDRPAVALTSALTNNAIAENSSTTSRTKVADIAVTDDALGSNTLALTGAPFLAGFFSKDEILWQAFSSRHGHWALWLVATAVAGLTAFYMFRIVILAFLDRKSVV
mgnify:CR=1 FL=1